MKYDVVIVASGKGERANLGYNKAFYKMKDGKTVLEHSTMPFIDDVDCQKIIVVTNKEYFDQVILNEKIIVIEGGNERKDSVLNGLNSVKSEYVLIHDGARPFIHKESVQNLKEKLLQHDAVILAKKSVDTVKMVIDGKVTKTLDRNTIYLSQTPQGFKTNLIKECYSKCDEYNFTDEASLVEIFGYDVYIVDNKYNNTKLTNEEDFKNL